MFPAESKKNKKSRKSSGTSEDATEPVDVLVDTVIGFLEQATAYMRAVANQVFTLLSGCVQESTIDLILAVSTRTRLYVISRSDSSGASSSNLNGEILLS